MYILLIIFLMVLILFIYKANFFTKIKNKKLVNFKKRFISKESHIEKIFNRQDEKTFSDPNINIIIDIYENENNVKRKLNIHRARLSKFKKSKLNGQMLYIDDEQKIFKYLNKKRIYI